MKTYYTVYWYNFNMTDQNEFKTRSEAVEYAKKQGFEYSIIKGERI